MWKDGENYYPISHSARVGKFQVHLDSLPILTSPSLWYFSGDIGICRLLSVHAHHFWIHIRRARSSCCLMAMHAPYPQDLWRDMLIEVKMYEILKQYPLPSICHYYGCIRDGQYLTALWLRKHKHTLYVACSPKWYSFRSQ